MSCRFGTLLRWQPIISRTQFKLVQRNFCARHRSNFKHHAPKNSYWKQLIGSVRRCFHPGAGNWTPLAAVAKKQVTTSELIRKMLSYTWPKGNWRIKKLCAVAMVLLVIAKCLNVYVPFILKNVINFYNDSADKKYKLDGDSFGSALGIAALSVIISYGLARTGSALFNELRNAVFARVAQHSVRNIARKIFLHLHSLDLSFHLNRQTGGMAKAIDRGTRGMAFIQSALVFNVIPTIVEVGMVSGLLYVNCGPSFAGATLGCLSTYAAATLAITHWRTKFRHQMNQADNDAGNRAIDSLINYETVKYFNNEKYEAMRYDHFLEKYEVATLKMNSSLALLNFTQNAIFSGGLVAVMCLAALNIQNGMMNVGDLVLANTLLFQLSVPLNFLGSVYREIKQGLVDMQLMFSLLKIESDIKDKPNAPPLKVTPEKSTVSFKNVSFGYLPGQLILKDFSIDIPSGKKVAIVGGSGSGKSTIVRLLYRLFDAVDGEIFINDQNITDVQLESLRKAIAIVPQDSVLFHETIFYNINYGNTNASEEEVYRVSKLADLHESVLRFQEGYNTLVGERGLKLSGGEKQRVAIARAILKNAPIIVYDEATSSLDAITEENIMKSVRSAAHKRTSLFIAHRLSTIVDADIIYVLEAGKVVEKGSHFELLADPNSRYSELWKSQHKYSGGVPPKPVVDNKYDQLDLDLDLNSSSGCCRRSGGGIKR